jgi:hypothetical protein
MKLKDPAFMTSAYWTQQYKNSYGNDVSRQLEVISGNARGSADSAVVLFEMHVDDAGQVCVAADGKLQVCNVGDRDPAWRERNEERYGVLIRPAKDLVSKLQCPHTGRKIPVSRIEDNPVLWVDVEHKVVLKSGSIGYDSPEGKPYHYAPEGRYTSHKIKYSFDNPKRFKAFEARWKNLWAEAKLRLSVMVVESRAYPSMSAMWDVFLRDEVKMVEDAILMNKDIDEVTRMWQLCRCIVDFDLEREHYRDQAKLKCADHYSANELILVG